MGVKGDNLEINTGLLLPSFILNYMVIMVKKKSWKKKKKRETSEGKRRTQRKAKVWGIACLITILRWR